MRFWANRLLTIAIVLVAAYAIPLTAMRLGGDAGDYALRLAVFAGLYVTLAVSLNLINGITGQFSIGHAGFYMVGAYGAGYVSQRFFEQSGMLEVVWLPLMVLVGAAFAGLMGFVVGMPSLRLRGDYLAIVTLGFGEIIRIVIQSIEEVGGSYGLEITSSDQAVWDIPDLAIPMFVWILAILCIGVCRNLMKSHHGLQFLAVRDDEVASGAMGVNVTKVKVTAFVIGSAFAGAAGALLGHLEGFISPDMFKMEVSFIILTMVVLGGTGSITGSVLAALVLFGVPEFMRSVTDAQGNPATFTGQALMAGILAVGLMVAVARKVMKDVHQPASVKGPIYIGIILGGFLVQMGLEAILGAVPALAAETYEVGNIRMLVFAGTLLALMLLRPQGVLAHHEFSWDWLGRAMRLPQRREGEPL